MWSCDAQAGARSISVCKTRLQTRLEESISRKPSASKPNPPDQWRTHTTDGMSKHDVLICIRNESVLGLEPRISCSVGRRLIHWAIRTLLLQCQKLATLYTQRRRPESERLNPLEQCAVFVPTSQQLQLLVVAQMPVASSGQHLTAPRARNGAVTN